MTKRPQTKDQRSASRTETLLLTTQRKRMLSSLEEALNITEAPQLSSLMILDVRDFREFNYSFGEICGDAILQAIMKRLQNIAWWDWPIEMILAHEAQICGGDVAALEQIAAPENTA